MKKLRLKDVLNLLGDAVTVRLIDGDGKIATQNFLNSGKPDIHPKLMNRLVDEVDPTGLNETIIVLEGVTK